MQQLNPAFHAEFDSINKERWNKYIHNFKDANLYQTWSYEEIRSGKKKMSHFILKQNKKNVAMAQIRIVIIPVIKLKIAYILNGSICKMCLFIKIILYVFSDKSI